MAVVPESHNGVHCCGTVGDSHSHSQLSAVKHTFTGNSFQNSLAKVRKKYDTTNVFAFYLLPLHQFSEGDMEKKRFALKKLLEAVEKELLHKPNAKTLDRLSMLAGFQDWESFQEALHGEADGKTNYHEKTHEQPPTTSKDSEEQPA